MKILIRIAIPLLITLMSTEGRTEILNESSPGINIFEYFTDLQRYSKLLKANPEPWMPWHYEAILKSLSPSKVAS